MSVLAWIVLVSSLVALLVGIEDKTRRSWAFLISNSVWVIASLCLAIRVLV